MRKRQEYVARERVNASIRMRRHLHYNHTGYGWLFTLTEEQKAEVARVAEQIMTARTETVVVLPMRK
ncbi:MAG TPA: hypothetical protein VMU25_00655 [Candidatus Paceibacterota bacterium]|nr:hypothetical protein [Candidatus Paceibacterota bacterium]